MLMICTLGRDAYGRVCLTSFSRLRCR